MGAAPPLYFFFFFNDTATTEIYTLSLHDALPISLFDKAPKIHAVPDEERDVLPGIELRLDRKSTRLNSSHLVISYAVFCLKKKNKKPNRPPPLAPRCRRPALGCARHKCISNLIHV